MPQQFKVGQKVYICRHSLLRGYEIQTYYVIKCDPKEKDEHPFQLGDSMRSHSSAMFMDGTALYHVTPEAALAAFIKHITKGNLEKIKSLEKEIAKRQAENLRMVHLTVAKCKRREYPADYEHCDY